MVNMFIFKKDESLVFNFIHLPSMMPGDQIIKDFMVLYLWLQRFFLRNIGIARLGQIPHQCSSVSGHFPIIRIISPKEEARNPPLEKCRIICSCP